MHLQGGKKMLLDLLLTAFFIWLLVKAVGLTLRVAWGLTKVIAVLLFMLAVPALVACLLFAGGLLLIIPVAMVGIAVGMLKSCI